MSSLFNLQPSQKAGGLFALSLLVSLFLALIISPSYGSDGGGYLRYIDTFKDPSEPDALWHIRGTTPIYPFFAYASYLIGFSSGYGIALIQILLGACVAPSLYWALREIDERGALLGGGLVAIDPQTGLLYQMVATEALYIAMLGLSMAAFFMLVQRELHTKQSLWLLFLFGFGLGVGSLVRPIGLFLIVPYAFFYVGMTRRIAGGFWMSLGYIGLILLICTINLWRFDFFRPYNTGGFYLATRLFGVGGLYDRQNGDDSEALYQLAEACDITLTDEADGKALNIIQNLRLCLFFEHNLSFDEVSSLYEGAYTEATRARPLSFISTMGAQLLDYAWQTSIPHDWQGAQNFQPDCDAADLPDDDWVSEQAMFCPQPPSPLSSLGKPVFGGMLAFSILTRVINFGLAALLFWRSQAMIRWLFLFCLAFYSYHAVVTAAAGTILARYVTVTNHYLLICLAFGLVMAWDAWHPKGRDIS